MKMFPFKNQSKILQLLSRLAKLPRRYSPPPAALRHPPSLHSLSLLHHSASPFICSLSLLTQYSSGRNTSHLKKLGKKLVEPICKCSEDDCDENFKPPGQLETHYRENHLSTLDDLPFICKCGGRFYSAESMVEHKLSCPLKDFRSLRCYLQIIGETYRVEGKQDKYAHLKREEETGMGEEEDGIGGQEEIGTGREEDEAPGPKEEEGIFFVKRIL